VAFARPLGASIKVLYLNRSKEVFPAGKTMKAQLKGGSYRNIDLEIEESPAGQSLPANLQKQVNRLRPSLIVMFTDQGRSFFQKIASPSNTEKVSFMTKIPLLSFHKD
jgi:hypothetical protein